MKNSQERSLVPYAVCFALAILGVVFPAMFFRELSAWAILVALAPFGLLELVGLWLVLDGVTNKSVAPK